MASKKTWEINSCGDRFTLSTGGDPSAEKVVYGNIVNTGNERPVRFGFVLSPDDAKSLGEMLIAASKEARNA